MRTILFVCTGNTCRSPMAEAIARHHLDRGLLGPQPDVFVASAGVGAPDGRSISPQAVRTLMLMQVPYEGRSKRLNVEMIRKADLVLCMTQAQAEAARELVGDSADAATKIQVLDPRGDIEDPIGMEQAAYDSLGKRLSELIPRRLKELLSNEDRTRVRSSR